MQGQVTGSPIIAIAVVEMLKPQPLGEVESAGSDVEKRYLLVSMSVALICKIFRVPELRIPVQPASFQKVETDMRRKGFKLFHMISPSDSLVLSGMNCIPG